MRGGGGGKDGEEGRKTERQKRKNESETYVTERKEAAQRQDRSRVQTLSNLFQLIVVGLVVGL